MRTLILTTVAVFLFTQQLYSQDEIDSNQIWINNIEESLDYQTGVIELEIGNSKLTVPKGFLFLDKAQSIYVLSDLWGNPPDSSILGMLVPENRGVMESNSWVFTISFDEMGYVKDEDADEINYDDLLKEQQKEFKEINPERINQGYQPIEFIGWASTPYYDKSKKILHWAKELKFGDDSLNTLNYNLRLLGRKGIFVINAIATMDELPEVKTNINKVVASIEFKEGHRYSDYLPDIDNVAAFTVGGLVAGKILAKGGFLVMLAKFWKVILLAIAGLGSGIWKFFNRSKNNETTPPSNNERE
jgi:uncharacterized membrane-anchored protein